MILILVQKRSLSYIDRRLQMVKDFFVTIPDLAPCLFTGKLN